MNLVAAFEATAAAEPGRVAIHLDGGTLTRADLRRAIVDAAATLRVAWSVRRGDRIGYLGFNRVEELVLLFALARIGAVLVPLNTRLAVTELVHIVTHAQLHVLATDASHRDIGVAVVEAVQVVNFQLRAIDELAIARRDLTSGAVEDAIEPLAADAPLLLVYTSGTTGAPKGALHTHAGLLANAEAAIAAHDMTRHDRVLTVLPLFHVGGLCIQTLPALLVGASVVLHPRFDAKAWLDAITTMRPTLTLMVPATLRAVIAERDWPDTNLSCLRVLMTGSSMVPRKLIDAVHARGVPVGQIYGSTETGPVTVALKAADAMRKPGFAGWPCIDGSVRLVDAAGGDVEPGAVGEIVVRAPNVMQGYWREPVGTGFRDGWFATGDLGRFDGDGCLEVVGRNRDLIVSGGENVYPAEVEDVLLSIAGVADAAVVGMPDEQWGEVPVAFVVRGGSAGGVLIDEPTIALAFRDRLARYKHPKRIVLIDRLPRNAMGKVQVHLLRERLAG
jgi:fatty-acyl-CoA synthase